MNDDAAGKKPTLGNLLTGTHFLKPKVPITVDPTPEELHRADVLRWVRKDKIGEGCPTACGCGASYVIRSVEDSETPGIVPKIVKAWIACRVCDYEAELPHPDAPFKEFADFVRTLAERGRTASTLRAIEESDDPRRRPFGGSYGVPP